MRLGQEHILGGGLASTECDNKRGHELLLLFFLRPALEILKPPPGRSKLENPSRLENRLWTAESIWTPTMYLGFCLAS